MNDYGRLATTGITVGAIGGVNLGWWAVALIAVGIALVLATSTRIGFRRRRGVTTK